MGIAVSDWNLARQVSLKGGMGVVSGTAIDSVLARRLQDGDPEGHTRRALATFPNQEMVARVMERYFIEGGKSADVAYAAVPKMRLDQAAPQQELSILASYVEVWLAREGHDGFIGINYLEKIQLSNLSAMLGAVIAGVDYVLMGAGIPREIPELLRNLSQGKVGSLRVDVLDDKEQATITVNPLDFLDASYFPMPKPQFLAIITSEILANYLGRDEVTRPEGFIIEGPVAGGHNAPPRGKLTLDEAGEPIYGPRDIANLEKMRALGYPFWMAGGYSKRGSLAKAIEGGAVGIQVGTLFALSTDSGFTDEVRNEILRRLKNDELDIKTDILASPTTFPIKIIQNMGGTDPITPERKRVCDLGYLRSPAKLANGRIDYRCAAEPELMFVKKGGELQETEGRRCLCNALLANVGMPQLRPSGALEPIIITMGSEVESSKELLLEKGRPYTAAEAVDYLLS